MWAAQNRGGTKNTEKGEGAQVKHLITNQIFKKLKKWGHRSPGPSPYPAFAKCPSVTNGNSLHIFLCV